MRIITEDASRLILQVQFLNSSPCLGAIFCDVVVLAKAVNSNHTSQNSKLPTHLEKLQKTVFLLFFLMQLKMVLFLFQYLLLQSMLK